MKNDSAFRRHSWAWLLNHSLAKEVDELRASGFGKAKTLTYFYYGQHPVMTGNVKKEGKIIAFNRGSDVDVLWYSEELATALGI